MAKLVSLWTLTRTITLINKTDDKDPKNCQNYYMIYIYIYKYIYIYLYIYIYIYIYIYHNTTYYDTMTYERFFSYSVGNKLEHEWN